MKNWLRKVLAPNRTPMLPPYESTKHELDREKRLREAETERTDRLAKILEDYRKWDRVLRSKPR